MTEKATSVVRGEKHSNTAICSVVADATADTTNRSLSRRTGTNDDHDDDDGKDAPIRETTSHNSSDEHGTTPDLRGCSLEEEEEEDLVVTFTASGAGTSRIQSSQQATRSGRSTTYSASLSVRTTTNASATTTDRTGSDRLQSSEAPAAPPSALTTSRDNSCPVHNQLMHADFESIHDASLLRQSLSYIEEQNENDHQCDHDGVLPGPDDHDRQHQDEAEVSFAGVSTNDEFHEETTVLEPSVAQPHQLTRRVLQPPAPPLIAELPQQPDDDGDTTFTDGIAEFGAEPTTRSLYRRRALFALVYGVALASLGGSLKDVRTHGNPGACCLPAGCNVMNLLQHDWEGSSGVTAKTRMCNFTESEWEVMGCLAQHQAVSANCTMSKPPLGEDGSPTAVDPCVHNEVTNHMLVTAILATVVGGLCVLSGFFCLCAFDCFGGIYQKPSTRHWVAKVVALLVWLGIFGSCLVGIVFSFWSSTMSPAVQTRPTCTDVDDKKVCEGEGSIHWEGEFCSVAQESGEVFNWINLTRAQWWIIAACTVCFYFRSPSTAWFALFSSFTPLTGKHCQCKRSGRKRNVS